MSLIWIKGYQAAHCFLWIHYPIDQTFQNVVVQGIEIHPRLDHHLHVASQKELYYFLVPSDKFLLKYNNTIFKILLELKKGKFLIH